MFYLNTETLGSEVETVRPPSKVPYKGKQGETIRVFLFDDVLLVTTWKYKYRYRLELKELAIQKKFDLLLFLAPDLFTVDDLIDMKAIDGAGAGSSTTLVCSNKEDRDAWALRLQKVRTHAHSHTHTRAHTLHTE